MSIETKCPECGARNKNPDDMEGKKATCDKCEARYVVGGTGSKKKADEDGIRKAAIKARGGRVVDDDDDEDEKPKSKSRRSRDDDDDDDDDKPRAKKKSRPSRDDDDDDEDDDRPARKPVKKSGGGGALFWILGGVAALLLLVCGGGVGGMMYLRYQAKKALVAHLNDLDQQVQDDIRKNGIGPVGPNGELKGGNDFGFGNPPKDIDEALKRLKSNNGGDKRSAADWLARQTVNVARQNEVAAALDPLIEDPDPSVQSSGMSALNKWATVANVHTVVKTLKATQPGPLSTMQADALVILGRLPDASGAEAVAPFLTTVFSSGQATQSLKAMGPVAEKTVVTYYNHPDDNAKSNARNLLVGYGTKDEVLIRQCITDLRGDNKDKRFRAAQSLNDTLKVNETLRPEVARAVEVLLMDRDGGVAGLGVRTLGKWGTKDNAPALIRCVNDPASPIRNDAIAALGRIPDQPGAEALAALLGTVRPQAGDALITMGQLPAGTFVAGVVKPYLQNDNRDVKLEAKRVLSKLNPGENVGLDLILTDLKSMDARTRAEAAQTLINMKNVDAARKAEVAKALEGVIEKLQLDPGGADNALKALATWGSKDNTPTLVAVLNTPGNYTNQRNSALNTLGVLKDEKALKTIVGLLLVNEHRSTAHKALLAYGPEFGEKMEGDVATVSMTALRGNDPGLAKDCCKILGAVGTKASVAKLTNLGNSALVVKPQHKDVADAATKAIAEINARNP
jgi:HEAT repeat protein